VADLIDLARAEIALNSGGGATFTSDQQTTINTLITSVSKAIQKFCAREFVSTTFDELYDGLNMHRLILRQFPIISISRVAYGPVSILRITNASTSNQRASVQVTSTGLSLVRVASGSSTTSTLTFAGNATLSALAAAVTALGNGWVGQVLDSSYNNWPAADLRSPQGALNAKFGAELRLHTSELSGFDIDYERGWILRTYLEPLDLTDPAGTGLTFFGGSNYWRIIYTAGFATVPETVQEACAEWVAVLYNLCTRDPAVVNSFTSGTGNTFVNPTKMPDNVRGLLEPWRRRSV
jgi:hypothetical protein